MHSRIPNPFSPLGAITVPSRVYLWHSTEYMDSLGAFLVVMALLVGPFLCARFCAESHLKRLAKSVCPKCAAMVGAEAAQAAMHRAMCLDGHVPVVMQHSALTCERCGAELRYLASEKKLAVVSGS